MGRSHTLSGLLAGCGLVALTSAPWPVETLAVAACGGGALLPDLDHPSSKVARSLGPVTRWLARRVADLAVATYHATRLEGDPPDRESGHRLLTHTLPACAAVGVVVALLVFAGPPAAAVTCGLLTALMAAGIQTAGVGLALAGGAGGWWVAQHHPGWWWLVAAAVAVGAAVHVAGDACTNSGVPALWPVVVDGRRWYRVTTPVTLDTGGDGERELVTPALTVACVAAAVGVSGLAGVLVTAVGGG